MTTQERQIMKRLIPDLLPMNHVSLSTKRVRFIQGQGALVYNDHYAVEIYLPKGNESAVFFGVIVHRGKMAELMKDYRRVPVIHINDKAASALMRNQFEEAVFQYEPLEASADQWIRPQRVMGKDNIIDAKEIFIHGNLSGAA